MVHWKYVLLKQTFLNLSLLEPTNEGTGAQSGKESDDMDLNPISNYHTSSAIIPCWGGSSVRLLLNELRVGTILVEGPYISHQDGVCFGLNWELHGISTLPIYHY